MKMDIGKLIVWVGGLDLGFVGFWG